MHLQSLLRTALATATLLAASLVWAGDFTATYTASTGVTYNIKGKEPATGKHPVFIYTVGMSESYDNAAARAAVDEMVAKGFVAASVQYDSASFAACGTIKERAKSIFNAASSASAIAKVCSRASADCSKGVVVAGFSQGGIVAVQARNYDSRVRAAYGLAAHNQYLPWYPTWVMGTCMQASQYTLSKSAVRIVDGEFDDYLQYNTANVRQSLQTVTNKSCGSGAYECLNTNGSGWIIVRSSAMNDWYADHCYQRYGGCNASDNGTLDSNWRNGNANWALKANLNWLNTYVTH